MYSKDDMEEKGEEQMKNQRSLQTVETTPESSTVIVLHMLSLNCKIILYISTIKHKNKLFYHNIYIHL